MTDLKETIGLMQSDDYKDRLKAEYWQTKIRYDKLHNILVKSDADTLEFTPNCPRELLAAQVSAMGQYLYALEVRAEVEKIDLENGGVY